MTKRPVVLIVEDEFLLRKYATGTIEDTGFEVVKAGNADEAIAIPEARPDIRVVFTDIQMPLKLAHYVRGKWPPIKIIATSGQMTLSDADLPKGGIFLSKPYAPEAISATLHTLTGS
jgi:two-component system, response regulator PdtaR